MLPALHNLRALSRLLAASSALTALILLAGCKGNTTSAALMERAVGKPPTLTASPTSGVDPRLADPLTNPLWQSAQWVTLTTPLNPSRNMNARTDAAVLFDADNLYVAFINEKAAEPELQGDVSDADSLFLDTGAGDGTEMIQISVDSASHTDCTWYRSMRPAQRNADGSPDRGHNVEAILDATVPDLHADVKSAQFQGKPAWTAVLSVPLRKNSIDPHFPLPLKTDVAEGQTKGSWKFNLVRTLTATEGSTRIKRLQANLSPIFVDTQPISPYRLATLQLGSQP